MMCEISEKNFGSELKLNKTDSEFDSMPVSGLSCFYLNNLQKCVIK